MIPLQQGIKVVCALNLEPEQRIWLSDGVAKPSGEQGYCESAIIPQWHWQLPSREQEELLYERRFFEGAIPWDKGSCIGIFRIPGEIISPFHELGIPLISSKNEQWALSKNPRYQEAIQDLTRYVKRFCLSNTDVESLGLAMHPPKLKTITSVTPKGYIGLHLDSWDCLPLLQRSESRNRICINLSLEDRFLLFINLTLMDLYRCLFPNSCGYDLSHWGNLGDEFMKQFPDYSVIKLKIAPGEAYIAPTENMIHDGSTFDKNTNDFSFTYLGDFGLSVRG